MAGALLGTAMMTTLMEGAQGLHHLLLAVNPVQVAEPVVAGAQLRAGLLEDEALAGGLDAEDGVGDAAAQGLDPGRPGADAALSPQVGDGVVRGQFQHGPLAATSPKR